MGPIRTRALPQYFGLLAHAVHEPRDIRPEVHAQMSLISVIEGRRTSFVFVKEVNSFVKI